MWRKNVIFFSCGAVAGGFVATIITLISLTNPPVTRIQPISHPEAIAILKTEPVKPPPMRVLYGDWLPLNESVTSKNWILNRFTDPIKGTSLVAQQDAKLVMANKSSDKFPISLVIRQYTGENIEIYLSPADVDSIYINEGYHIDLKVEGEKPIEVMGTKGNGGSLFFHKDGRIAILNALEKGKSIIIRLVTKSESSLDLLYSSEGIASIIIGTDAEHHKLE
jgi:hypothetical protein